MEQFSTLTKFISAWNWHIIALLFLVASLILFALPSSIKTIVLLISFLIVFFVCEIIAYLRREQMYNEK